MDKKASLLDMLRKEEYEIPSYCGGKGLCGKCKVRFQKEAPMATEQERIFFSKEEIDAGWRLACEQEEVEISNLEIPLAADHSMIEKKEYHQEADSDICDIVVDIGTTTIGAAKVDRKSKKVLKTITSMNHQRSFGADVISRIDAANRGKGKELQQSIQRDLKNLFQELDACVEGKEKSAIVISCNTTMGHLLQGFSCKGLGVAPYQTGDISLHTYEKMIMLPGISAFAGADLVSGIVAVGMHKKDEISILVDVGTNGEMAIGNKNRILVASAAAGPAFEGGNISCGVAGIPGAISGVEFFSNPLEAKEFSRSEENIQIRLETIQGKRPVGICGTGVLETVYELRKKKLMDETGLLKKEYFSKGFPLTKDIFFTIGDVRQVQAAKSAIRTGIELLIKEYGVDYEEIHTLYLAGSFGEHMNIRKTVGIGLLPQELEQKTVSLGNTSLLGGILYLTEPERRQEFVETANRAEEILLAEHKDFQGLYLKYMYFPE